MNTNIVNRFNNNDVIAQYLFDEIGVWMSQKKPKQDIWSLVGDIKKILDKVEKRSYHKDDS